jgi:acyl dehydratase
MRLLVYRHVVEQGAGLAAMGRLALGAVRRQGRAPAPVAGEWLRATVRPPSRGLVRDYVRECGGDPAAWGDELPPHLLAQFGFPVAMRVVAGLPYPVHRTLNAGCAWERRAPLPVGAPLEVRARLAALEADETRARGSIAIEVGAEGAPEALRAEMRVYVPLARGRGAGRRREPPAVPPAAQLRARHVIGADAGAAFAALTGDFNPIHWLWPAARLAGFPGLILQGFALHARAVEAIGAALPGGVRALRAVDATFVRPLVLPADVGVYAEGDQFWLGSAPGAPASVTGSYRAEGEG